MSRVAQQRGNVRAIRPGLAIPTNREEDKETLEFAKLVSAANRRAYELAQTEPNSHRHRTTERLGPILAEKLPRNNLRLIVTPISPKAEWFWEAKKRVNVARCERALVDSRWSYAYMLDQQDGGERHKALEGERDRTENALKHAILDALRTPTTRRADALAKQDMIGKREWAAVYRPDWQAIVDEDIDRWPVKSRKPRKQEAQA